MNRIDHLVRRAPLVWFMVGACAFTWMLLPWAANSIGISLLALCGPAVAARAVTRAMTPAEQQDFRSRLTSWRIPIRWYLLALMLPWPVTLLRSGLECRWVGGEVALLPISPTAVAVFVLVAGEEIGWRGFVLPHLLRRFNAFQASVILGVLWACWHVPLFSIRGMPQFGTPFLAFALYTVALSLILTGLAQKTAGSVLIATLFHGAVNTFGWINPGADPELRGWFNALCYGLLAVVVSPLWSPVYVGITGKK